MAHLPVFLCDSLLIRNQCTVQLKDFFLSSLDVISSKSALNVFLSD
jgi:hypothetical protein